MNKKSRTTDNSTPYRTLGITKITAPVKPVGEHKNRIIKSNNDLINLINNFFIFGYGTTSYLPVFNFIDNFKIKNCHSRIRGLIYYTDGLGTIFDSKKEFTYLYCNENNRILKLIPRFS